MATLPTEKVQDMINKLQEYHAAILVKIDEKRAEMETLLLQKLEHARVNERRRYAHLVPSPPGYRAEGHVAPVSPTKDLTVTELRITTPPGSVATASPTRGTHRARTMKPAQCLRGVCTGPPLEASMVDTVVVSPMSPSSSTLNRSDPSVSRGVQSFAQVPARELLPLWSPGTEAWPPNGPVAAHRGSSSGPVRCGVKRVRFSSRSPQVALLSVERCPYEDTGDTSGEQITERLSFTSDSIGSHSASTASRSSSEIRASFQAGVMALRSDIDCTRSRIAQCSLASTPSGAVRTRPVAASEAATPTSSVTPCDECTPHTWLDPLSPFGEDSDAAHGPTPVLPSPSFTGSPLLRPATARPTYGALSGSSSRVKLPSLVGGRGSSGSHECASGTRAPRQLARKVRTVSRRPATSSNVVSQPNADRKRCDARSCSHACGGLRGNAPAPNVTVNQVRGLSGNISLACGPTLYFSD